MAAPSDRPTTEVADVILNSMDRMFEQLVNRLDGLTDDEYLWEPVAAMWSVRPNVDGDPSVEGAGQGQVDPAPLTTIAWRLWHISIACFDDYTRRFAGDTADAPATFTLIADEAVATLHEKWKAYRSLIAGRDWWHELGDNWEFWSQHAVADMAIHASNELVHHGAEIALLRDLYRANLSQQ